MPKVPDAVLDSVVYFYSSKQDAEDGEAAGGTGFLIGVGSDLTPEAETGLITVYAVTARHVAKRGASVVRALSRRDPTPKLEILTFSPDDWSDLPSVDDVAVCPVAALPPALHHTYSFVRDSQILTKERLEEPPTAFGPGDDVYMVGRFIGHDGRQRNLPSVRFGNIAMMPWEPIKSETGIDQESFLVEMRSLPGYSGSPVFVYHTEPALHLKDGVPVASFESFSSVWLLGVDWCHLPNYRPVLESTGGEPIEKRWVVEQNSGMAGVVPAWKLQELLFEEELVEMRQKAEQEYRKQAGPGQLDVATPTTDDEFEKFADLAQKVVNIPKTEIDELRES